MANPKRYEFISFTESEIGINGDLYTGALSAKIKDQVGREIGRLTREGRNEVVRLLNERPPQSDEEKKRAGQRGRGRTGFTAQNVQQKHSPVNSLYGKVRMRPHLRRPGSESERVPYIVARVIENGRRGGSRQYVVKFSGRSGWARYRSTWKKGGQVQKPVLMFGKTAGMLRKVAPARIEAVIERVAK